MTTLNDDNADALLGVSESFTLVYVESDVKPGTFSEKLLHGTLSKGFHLMKVVKIDEANKPLQDACAQGRSDLCNAARSTTPWMQCV